MPADASGPCGLCLTPWDSMSGCGKKKKKTHPRPLAPQPTVSPEKQVLLPPPGRRGNRGKEGDLCNLVAGTL